MLEHVSNGPIFVGAVFLYKRAKCGKPAEKRGNVDCQGFGQDLTGNCISCTFCAIWSEIGPESTSMVGARKSRSERFVCQKSEFALLSRPSAPKGRDLCIFSRGAHFLSARTLKTSEFLDPDSGPIFDPFLHKCEKRGKCGKTRRKAQKRHLLHFLRNLVRNRPRIHVDGRRSKVPVGAIRLSEIGIRFVIASVCSERTRSVYFFSRGAFFKRANTENEPIPGSRFWAYF